MSSSEVLPGWASRLRAWRYKERLTALLEALQPQMGDRILDLGAGTGYIAGRVAKYSGKVCAVEPQVRGVEYISRAYSAVEARVGTAESIPYDDSSFDKAYILSAFHHFGDFDGAIGELRRVLKVGGLLVVQDRDPTGLGARFEKMMARGRVRFLAASELVGYLNRDGFAVRDNPVKGVRFTLTATRSS